MRIDLYTKSVLTIIAVFLAVIMIERLGRPQPVSAQSTFGAVQIAPYDNTDLIFFDPSTGDVWAYSKWGNPPNGGIEHYKLTQLGKPLEFHGVQ